MAKMPATKNLVRRQRLYINIDHVATVRQARRGIEPDPVATAALCERAGADGITAHLREDRRHIQDADIERLVRVTKGMFNLEMACVPEMLGLAERLKPKQVTLVPEKRAEVTTEGGLDVGKAAAALRAGVRRLTDAGILVSLFIDPDIATVNASRDVGAAAIELNTGRYSNYPNDQTTIEALRLAARRGAAIGLAVDAGHGLSVANVGPVAAITEIGA